jgi:hypothetical protein
MKTQKHSYSKVFNCQNNCNEECILFDEVSHKKRTLFVVNFPEMDNYLKIIKPFKFNFLNEELQRNLRTELLKYLCIEEYYCDYEE